MWAKIRKPMFFRVTRAGPHQYVQIARSFRDGSVVRQQTLLSLGRLDLLQATGQFDSLLRSGLRLCERLTVVDAHASGETEPVALKRIGPDLVFSRLWDQSGIQRILQHQLEGRRFDFPVERAIYLTVLHRLFASGVATVLPNVGASNTVSPVPTNWISIICIGPWRSWAKPSKGSLRHWVAPDV